MLPSISVGASYSKTAIAAVTPSHIMHIQHTGSGVVRNTLFDSYNLFVVKINAK